MAQYDKFADKYEELMGDIGEVIHQKLINPALDKVLSKVKAESVLDAGCGNGYWSKRLSSMYKFVTAVDNSKKLLQIASSKRQARNLTYKIVDLEGRLPFENISFDLIFSNMVLHYVKNIEGLSQEFFRVLTQDGNLIFTVTDPDYEFRRDPTLKEKLKRTKFQLSSLGGKDVLLDLYYSPLEKYLDIFKKAGFTLVKLIPIKITKEAAALYPNFKNLIGVNRVSLFWFRKV